MAKKIDNKPLVIAHRGASGHAPENTKAAFLQAIKERADAIEFDVHVTKDKQLVVIHDATINRTSNGHGFVHLMTLQELQQYNFGTEKKKEKISTLEEALRLITRKSIALVELKWSTRGHEHLVVETIKNAPNKKNIWVHSSHKGILKTLHQKDPTIKLGYIILFTFFQRFFLHWELRFARRYNISFFSVDELLINKPFVQDFLIVLRTRNIAVFPWVINDRKAMKEMIALGVQGIITNYPATLRKLFNSRKT